MNLPPKTPPTGLDLIHETSAWPHWPFLPMVRRYLPQEPTELGSRALVGVLTCTDHGYSFAPGVNLWSRLADAQFTPCEPEQLLAEGWEVR